MSMPDDTDDKAMKRRSMQTSVTAWLDADEVAVLDTLLEPGQSRSGLVTEVLRAHLAAVAAAQVGYSSGHGYGHGVPAPRTLPNAATASRSGFGAPAAMGQAALAMAGTALAVAGGRGGLPVPVPPSARRAPSAATPDILSRFSLAGGNRQPLIPGRDDGYVLPTAPSAQGAARYAGRFPSVCRVNPLSEPEAAEVREAILAIRAREHDRQRRPPLSVRQLVEAAEAAWLGAAVEQVAHRGGVATAQLIRMVQELEEELEARGIHLSEPEAALPRRA